MAWTIETAAKVYLAETGSLVDMFTGGSARFYNAGATLLATCTVGTPSSPGDGTSVISPSAGTVVSADTCTNAKLCDSAGTPMMSTNDVGTSANDIVFDAVIWALNGSVTPSTITLDLASITAVKG